MKKKRNYKKLTIDDRMIIQAGLANHESLTQIAKRLHKNKSTISKEISRKVLVILDMKDVKLLLSAMFVLNVVFVQDLNFIMTL